MSENHQSQFGRRELLKGVAATSLWAMAAPLLADDPKADTSTDVGRRPKLIRQENAKPGATDWQLTRVRLNKSGGLRSPWIEGYCSKQSVEAGESIDIMVSTDPATAYLVEIFRTGYYGGRGARLMKTLGPFPGKSQPTPPVGEPLGGEA